MRCRFAISILRYAKSCRNFCKWAQQAGDFAQLKTAVLRPYLQTSNP